MIKSQTVFIVGAGASKEVKLPIGKELTLKIANLLQTEKREGRTYLSNSKFNEIIREISRNSGESNSCYYQAAQSISQGMILTNSIDEFLNTHQNNKNIAAVGKAAIVTAILNAERHSYLFLNFEDSEDLQSRVFTNSLIQQTWYARLFDMLTRGGELTDFVERLKNITFIVFNYDRCIEHFFLHGMITYFGIDLVKATSILDESLIILHPYGTIGKTNDVNYGNESIHPSRYVEISKNLKTFTEGVRDDNELQQIKTKILESGILVFLGFGYHSLNMKLLELEQEGPSKKIYGTVYNRSGSDCLIIKESIINALKLPQNQVCDLLNGSCCNLFEEYSLSLGIQ